MWTGNRPWSKRDIIRCDMELWQHKRNQKGRQPRLVPLEFPFSFHQRKFLILIPSMLELAKHSFLMPSLPARTFFFFFFFHSSLDIQLFREGFTVGKASRHHDPRGSWTPLTSILWNAQWISSHPLCANHLQLGIFLLVKKACLPSRAGPIWWMVAEG